MMLQFLSAIIYFVACHAGPANHFATFAKELENQGHNVHLLATGTALKTFQDLECKHLTPFSLEDPHLVAKKINNASVIITDVGHPFDITLHNILDREMHGTLRIAYYDNPEPYVPGGYSEIAAQVLPQAHTVLFANANLAHAPIFRVPFEEIVLPKERNVGLGYYPLTHAERLRERRASERIQQREEFFAQNRLVDTGQKVWVLIGGNNDAYFSAALPATLGFFDELSDSHDLSDLIVVLHQHPGAKAVGRDKNLVLNSARHHPYPRRLISNMPLDDALVLADTVLYFQTSMAPLFALAKIPTVQIGHEVYPDILVKSQLCLTVNSEKELAEALTNMPPNQHEGCEIEEKLGIRSNWLATLEGLLP